MGTRARRVRDLGGFPLHGGGQGRVPLRASLICRPANGKGARAQARERPGLVLPLGLGSCLSPF